MFTVKSFCGYSLRTGTLTILLIFFVLHTVFIVHNLLKKCAPPTVLGEAWPLLVLFILITVLPLGIYGAFEGKPLVLIPFVGYLLLSSADLLILMIVVAIFGPSILYEMWSMPFDRSNDNRVTEIIIVEVVHLVLIGFMFYFIIGVLSYYKELRRNIKLNPGVT